MGRILVVAAGVFLGIIAVIVFLVAAPFSSAAWEVQRNVDPITDAVSVEAFLRSEDGGGVLGLFCGSGQLAIAVQRRARFSTSDSAVVTIRMDQQPPFSVAALQGDDAIYISSSSRQLPEMLAQLAGSRRVAVRIEDERAPGDLIFNSHGADAAMEAVRVNCRAA